ncbi:MAG TPA: DUF309 domain-containing protein [Gaiellaceae bacterium]|nr:DUF309 domain-containing protein [Gaiellaceae bacterium]
MRLSHLGRLRSRRLSWGWWRDRRRSPPAGRSPAPAADRRLSKLLSAFEHGLELIRSGEFFAAHEELELAWRAAREAERDFYQGLVHVAVAWYQAGRGNRVGCERQLEKAERRLGPYAPLHEGVDVASVLEQVRAAAAVVRGGSLDLPPPRL